MFTPKEIFEDHLASRLANPAKAEKYREIDAIYQFNVNGDAGGSWVVDLKGCTVFSGTSDEADCTITIADSDFVGLVSGEIQGPQLYFQGRLQVGGNMGLALKLDQVLKD